MRRNVDFPQPDGPMIETNSPASMDSETSPSASVMPARLVNVRPTPAASMISRAHQIARRGLGDRARRRRSTSATAW